MAGEVTVSAQMYLSNIDEMLDKVFEDEPTVTDAYFGDSIQHIQKRTGVVRGTTVRFLTQHLSDAGITADLEADARTGQSMEVEELEITRSHLRRLDHTITKGVMADALVDGSDLAIWNGAAQMGIQAVRALDVKENQAFNSDKDSKKAAVVATYNTLGGTYNASATSAVVTIDGGGIAMFSRGEVLAIRNSTTNAVRLKVQVRDVFQDKYVYGTNLSYPSLRLTITSDNAALEAAGTVEDIIFDNLADGDEITHYGDYEDSGWDASWGAMCDVLTTSPPTYFGVTRTGMGKDYLLPYARDYASAGVDQPLDLDAIFDDYTAYVANLIGPSRMQLDESMPVYDRALIWQVNPKLIPSMQRQASDSGRRWNIINPSTLDAAKRKQMIAVTGWNGLVIQSFGLPPIAVQSEPQMSENQMRIWDPAMYDMLQLGGTSRQPTWLRNDAGGRWHVQRNATTGALKFFLDAVCWRVSAPFCRLPKVQAHFTGLAAG